MEKMLVNKRWLVFISVASKTILAQLILVVMVTKDALNKRFQSALIQLWNILVQCEGRLWGGGGLGGRTGLQNSTSQTGLV